MYVYWVFSTTLVLYIVPAVILSMLLPHASSRDKRQTEEGQRNNSALTSSPTGASRNIQPSAVDTSATDMLTKELAPEFTFAVHEDDGKICILAKFSATFTITYPSQGGEQYHMTSKRKLNALCIVDKVAEEGKKKYDTAKDFGISVVEILSDILESLQCRFSTRTGQAVSVNLPEDAQAKGRCGTSKAPLLELSWPGFRLSMIFSTIPSSDKSVPDSWVLESMELQYNTGNLLFDGASNAGKQTARSPEGILYFETPIGKSYFCPSPDMIPMLNTKRERVVLARLKDVRLQVFDVQKGLFSPAQRCSLVRIGGIEPFQDETVPIAVGSTLAVVAVLVVIGYALYRNLATRKTDYSTME